LPITTLYAALLTILWVALANRVATMRRREKIGIGHGDSRPLRRAIRVHANFSESVPLTVVMMALVEAGGAPAWGLHAAGAAILLGRLMHAAGLSRTVGLSVGRFGGLALHWGAMFALAALGLAQSARALL